MLRSLRRLSRTPRVLFALWLAIALAQPAGAHVCPVHDPVAAAMATRTGHASMHHDVQGDGRASQRCHCMGDCCAQLATPLPASPARIPAPLHILAGSTRPLALEQSFEEPEHLLPPSTAPPAFRLA